jgi:hypothetical protein
VVGSPAIDAPRPRDVLKRPGSWPDLNRRSDMAQGTKRASKNGKLEQVGERQANDGASTIEANITIASPPAQVSAPSG